MTSIMRRTVRGASAGLGALAIIAGATACGGLLGGGDAEGDGAGTAGTSEEGAEDTGAAAESGSEQESADARASEDAAAEDAAAEDAGEEAAEEGEEAAGEGADAQDGEDAADGGSAAEGEAAAEPLSEEDLTAVGDQYFAFIQAAAASDGQAACGLITHPSTGEPLAGAELAACAQGFEGEAEAQGIDPALADALERSMFEGVDNGDGTAGVTMMGSDAGVTFVKAGDQWYIDGSDFV